MENIGGFKKLFQTASATLNYQRSTQESGRAGSTETKNYSTQITPALVTKWKNGMNTTLGVVVGKRISEGQGTKNEQTNITINFDLKYSFAAGQGIRIPLPFISKRLKFKSTLDSSLNISYARNSGKRFTAFSPVPEPLPGTNTLRVAPQLTYNFSRTLNGSFFIDYSRSYSESSNQTTTVLSIGISAVFLF